MPSLLIAFLTSLLQTTLLQSCPTINSLMKSGVFITKSRTLSTSDYLHVILLVWGLTQRSGDFKDYPRNSCHTALYRTYSNIVKAHVLELKHLCLKISWLLWQEIASVRSRHRGFQSVTCVFKLLSTNWVTFTSHKVRWWHQQNKAKLQELK